VLGRLTPLPQHDGVYLATESFPRFWEQAGWNRDHPSLLAALGLLPGEDVDSEVMGRTLQAVEAHWDLRQTWGWDFPMMAMTAARLHEPEKAIELLLYDAPNNHFGATGMTARMQDSDHRVAATYFPSNGSLLFAAALLAAGWDGESGTAPGFPRDGHWQVRSEGLQRLP
jgi:hypothetical protein